MYVSYLFTDATIYVGGLDEKVSDTLMWELFVQAGPVGKILWQYFIHTNVLKLTIIYFYY